jgi:uncharacterized protein (TIGR03435 family)
MISLSFLAEFALRAALIATGTAAILAALRIRSAAARHAAWTAVVLAMLALPVSLAGGVRVFVPVLQPAPTTVGTTIDSRGAVQSESATAIGPGAPAEHLSATIGPASESNNQQARPLDWEAALFGIYLSGMLVLLIRLVLGTVQANRLRATAVIRDGRLTSARCVTPITVGWFTPALILPDGWDRWPAAKLGAVLTHEKEHARRHDPVVQWLALLNRAVFWFHPLAWWLERRLSTLAEEACDAAVLAAGHSPHDYSEYLLEMARSVSRDGRRLQLVGMAMPGTGLTHRLRLIFQELPMMRVSRTRVVCTMVFCAMSSGMFASGTLAERTPAAPPVTTGTAADPGQIASDATTPSPNAPPSPPETPPAISAASQPASAQAGGPVPPAPAMQIKFDVVSIKPCLPAQPSGRGGGTSMRFSISPGYAHWGCVSLAELIDIAWNGGFPDNALLNTLRLPPNWRPDLPKRVRGGPGWVEQERFEIEVRMSGDASELKGSAHHDQVAGAMGPALRAMLEDRFQLKMRKATEQKPMYALTVAKGGLKIPQTATATEPCWKIPPDTPRGREPVPPPGSEKMPPCHHSQNVGTIRGNKVWEMSYINLTDFATLLSRTMDRYVLNQTRVDGRFSFKLEYAPDDSTPGDAQSRQRSAEAFAGLRAQQGLPPQPAREPVQPDGPTIFKALEALGLHLEPTRGPAEYLLIESVQRPKPNGP